MTRSLVLKPGCELGPDWGPIKPRSSRPGLPFLFLNAAITADGKIAPASRRFEPFGSSTDARLLYQLRTYADAVMCGARTLDLNAVKLGNGGRAYDRMRERRGLSAHPVRVVVSGSASIDPGAEIFKHRFSPIILLTTKTADARRLRRLRPLVDEIVAVGRKEIDFETALRQLRFEWRIRRLLCEGGGELNDALFRRGLVDEVYLTICPLVLGGKQAPTLADGIGGMRLADVSNLKLQKLRQVGAELFLVYRVVRTKGRQASRQ